MSQMNIRRHRTFFLGAVLGATFGAGVLAGVLAMAGLYLAKTERPLDAVATSSADTMAIATGPIAEGVEGLFILDFITGELTCQAFHPKTGNLGGAYRRNVAGDLGAEQGKSPKYLLITGFFHARQNIGNVRPAESLVYVADVNTGKYVAYMLPWNKLAAANYQTQVAEMMVVGGGSARNVAIEN